MSEMSECAMFPPNNTIGLSLGEFHKLMTFFDKLGVSDPSNSAVYEFVYENDGVYVELTSGHAYRFVVNFSR